MLLGYPYLKKRVPSMSEVHQEGAKALAATGMSSMWSVLQVVHQLTRACPDLPLAVGSGRAIRASVKAQDQPTLQNAQDSPQNNDLYLRAPRVAPKAIRASYACLGALAPPLPTCTLQSLPSPQRPLYAPCSPHIPRGTSTLPGVFSYGICNPAPTQPGSFPYRGQCVG